MPQRKRRRSSTKADAGADSSSSTSSSSSSSSSSSGTSSKRQDSRLSKAEALFRDKYWNALFTTRQMFLSDYGAAVPLDDKSSALRVSLKYAAQYGNLQDEPTLKTQASMETEESEAKSVESTKVVIEDVPEEDEAQANKKVRALIRAIPQSKPKHVESKVDTTALIAVGEASGKLSARQQLILSQRARMGVRPTWHAPWKLMRVISGHIGWVHSVAVDPSNEWFVTGSADRTIKIWDLASGSLKLTLTGHISAVRGLVVSDRHPYLFSCGEDKTVKCWDLEQNKVIRSYHGHLSGVYALAMHPTLDVLVSGGRDAAARVWDIRTKAQVRVMSGHQHTIGSIITQPTDPQIVTGSHDCTVRCWDLSTGKTSAVLTNHKKSVRALVAHPNEYTFASGAADNIKVWKCPEGRFLRNLSGHNAIVNTLAVNTDNVLVSGADNGSLCFWDWKSGYQFQNTQSKVQPGSLDSEAGIFMARFDMTGSRLITCEADKTIKVWKEDEEATPETHPIDWKPTKRSRY